jgi:hypothetical protein
MKRERRHSEACVERLNLIVARLPCAEILRWIASAVAAILTVVAAGITPGDGFIGVCRDGWTASSLVVVLVVATVLLLFYRHRLIVRPSASVVLASFMLAIITYYGKGLSQSGSISFLMLSPSHIFESLVCVAGFMFLYVSVLSWIWKLLDRSSSSSCGSRWKGLSTPKCIIVFLLCWAPYVALCLPGVLMWDMCNELVQGIGVSVLTNHHPVVDTYIYTLVFSLGFWLGGTDTGCLALLLFQTSLFAGIFSLCLAWLGKMGVPRFILISCLLFWAVVPAIPLYIRYYTKDVLACAAYVFFMLQVVIRLWSGSTDVPRIAKWPAIVGGALFCCLTRNDSIYVILPTLLVLVALPGRREKIQAMSCAVGTLILVLVWSSFVLPFLGVAKSNIRESLSVPLQQTARYIKEHPDDITREEHDAIQESCSIDVGSLGSLYNKDLSDPVKSVFNFSSRQSMVAYFSAWLSMGLRHPGTYLAALLEDSLGYWYPVTNGGSYNYLIAFGTDGHPFNANYLQSNGPTWDVAFSADRGSIWFPDLNGWAEEMMALALKCPIIGSLLTPAAYVWATFFLLVYLCSKRNRAGLLWVSMLVRLIILVASPVNGSIRYALPVVAVLPVVLACVYVIPKEQKESSLAIDG